MVFTLSFNLVSSCPFICARSSRSRMGCGRLPFDNSNQGTDNGREMRSRTVTDFIGGFQCIALWFRVRVQLSVNYDRCVACATTVLMGMCPIYIYTYMNVYIVEQTTRVLILLHAIAYIPHPTHPNQSFPFGIFSSHSHSICRRIHSLT